MLLEQGRSHNRLLRNRELHSREQSLRPRQGNRDQDRDQERLRSRREDRLGGRHAGQVQYFGQPEDEQVEIEQATKENDPQ